MTEITSILFQTILPVFMIAGIGYLLHKRLDLDVRTVSRVCLYVLTPALGFSSIAGSQMSGDEMWRMALISASVVVSMAIVGHVTGRLLHLGRADRSALQVSLAFANCGNIGLSVCYFAFGDAGLERAIIYFVTSAVLGYSLGVFLASRGGAAGTVSASLRNTLSMPVLYGALLGLGVNITHWTVPETLMKAIDLVGRASVPMMLLVLGMQLSRARFGQSLRILSVGTVLKLLVAPVFGFLFATLLSLHGVAWQVALVESAMPTAVTNVIITSEFEASPEVASSMVLTTTLFSVVTLTALLAIVS